MSEPPFLSAIVIAQNNATTIARTVASIVSQQCSRPFETILVDSGTDHTAEIVKSAFPHVIIVKLSQPVFPGTARNEGLKIAKGSFVSFPGSHVELPSGSLEARMEAHAGGHALVTGTFLNGTDTRAGWASYFMDHSASLPGRPSGLLESPPTSCSYDRRVLMASGLFPEDRRAGEDTVVNERLWKAGFRAYRDRRIVLTHITRCRTPWLLATHHFSRGRAYGRILREIGRGSSAGYVAARLSAIKDRVEKWGDCVVDQYVRAKPLIKLGVISAWSGMQYEFARFATTKDGALTDR